MGNVNIGDFQRLDIRIGTVKKAEVPAWSHWVMKLTVDFGPSFAKATESKRTRIIFAGIKKWYNSKDLEGKQFPFVVNIEPKKIGPEGDYSDGMLMAADVGEGDKERCILFSLSKKVPNGTKVR